MSEIEQGLVTTPDGARLCVYRLGDGEQTVIVPNAVYLLEHFAYLARHFTVLCYDLRNRGRSASIDDEALLARGVHHDVEDIETVRAAFEVDRAHLVGHSYLGIAVVLYAIAHPERVDRIVQISPVGPDPEADYPPDLRANDVEVLLCSDEAREVERMRKSGDAEAHPEAFCKAWWRFMKRVYVADPDAADQIGDHFCAFPNEWPQNVEPHLREHVWPSIQRLGLEDREIDRIEAPVLTVHGTRDRNSPYGAGRDWALRLRHARLLRVEGAGHLPYLENPGLVQPAIEHFLAGHWPEASKEVTEL